MAEATDFVGNKTDDSIDYKAKYYETLEKLSAAQDKLATCLSQTQAAPQETKTEITAHYSTAGSIDYAKEKCLSTLGTQCGGGAITDVEYTDDSHFLSNGVICKAVCTLR
jgi:hypothetical protein